ncbi:MAG: ATP-dependent helicase HrpB [Cellvibrionaceae bacterium]
MTKPLSTTLPIESALPELKSALGSRHEVVLEAPPGAGKTTLVPLALLDEKWLGQQKILVLEPRRLAARGAAERMAAMLEESVGETVGYRVRLETKVSSKTRIEVITEGILNRMLQADPSLEGVGLVIFDEFHERNLNGDLGLALCLQGREMFRSETDGELPLKLLVMSATLDGDRIADLLGSELNGKASLVRSEGRSFPVDIFYSEATRVSDDPAPLVVKTIQKALKEQQGNLLVFLPGQGEIRRVQSLLEGTVFDEHSEAVAVCPLYGDLSLAEQRKAIAPTEKNQRKVVLATSIAESSLTIEGIRVVIDSGLSRLPMFDPSTGMTRLHTKRLSQASSIQRAGRAGRIEPGVCYRLWSESQQQQLIPFTPAEIEQADLAPLALQLLQWGVSDPSELRWLTSPNPAPFSQALDLLQLLGAVEYPDSESKQYTLTSHGELMASLPCHPRLAHMLLVGGEYGQLVLAANIAALLSERDPCVSRPSDRDKTSADITERLSLVTGEMACHSSQKGVIHRIRQQSKQYQAMLSSVKKEGSIDINEYDWPGLLLACAYPDRIAKQRKSGGGDYQLSNGRSAQFYSADSLQKYSWLVIAQQGSRAQSSREQIFMAASLNSDLFQSALSELVNKNQLVQWDENTERFLAEEQRLVGKLTIASSPINNISPEAKQQVLLDLIRQRGLDLLPWNDDLRQWRARVSLLRHSFNEDDSANPWPDLSDEYLLESLDAWLGPYLDKVSHIKHFAQLDLKNILLALLPWPLPQQLDEMAPDRIAVPSGSNIRIDYSENPPVLAVKLQEMFGCAETPVIAKGRIPLKLHLLSPARRPLAVTQDLSSFWSNAYTDVKKDMKGRYPKHYWPDDPMQAEPTARAKRRK